MRPHQRKKSVGKKKIESQEKSLENAITGTLKDCKTSDESSQKYDEFAGRVMGLYRNPRYTELSLRLAKEYLEEVDLKNFYRLSEFVKEKTGEIYEIPLPSFSYGPKTPDRIRSDLQGPNGYLKRATKETDQVTMESYELENGRLKKINHLRLCKKRIIARNDFPEKEGLIKLCIEENGTKYAMQIEIKRNAEGIDGDGVGNTYMTVMRADFKPK